MKTFTYVVTDPLGLHARPASLLVKTAKSFESRVGLACGEKTGDAKKLFSVMALEAAGGKSLTVTVEGPDEEAAAEAIEALLRETL